MIPWQIRAQNIIEEQYEKYWPTPQPNVKSDSGDDGTQIAQDAADNFNGDVYNRDEAGNATSIKVI